MSQDVSEEALEELLAPFRGQQGVLLAIFHTIQDAYGYIPPQGVSAAAKTLGLPPAHVYGTLTFYSDLRTSPPPKHSVQLCHGPACHLKGTPKLIAIAEETLGIKAGQLNPAGHAEIHLSQCAGLCDHAPTLSVNQTFYRRVSPQQLKDILSSLPQGENAP